MNPIRVRTGCAVWSRALLLLLTLPLLRCQGEPAGSVPVSFSLSPDHPRIAQGTGQGFALRATFADGRSQDVSAQVKWTVVDELGRDAPAATLLPGPIAGLIAVENPGRFRVRATLAGQVLETSLEVTTATLTSVSISPIEPLIALGTNQQFALTGRFSDGSRQDVTALSAWSLKTMVGTGVAVIDSSGLATSKAAGIVSVAGRYKSKTATTTLQVTAATAISLKVLPASPSVAKGTSLQFAAQAIYSDGSVQDVTTLATWSVQDVVGTGVAQIDDSGNALGHALGQAAVSAQYKGLLASTTMTVTAALVSSISVAPATAAVPRGLTKQFAATAHFTDATTRDVTAMAAWTASDVSGTGVASVDAHGVATGKAAGTANIAAAYSGLAGGGVLTVTAPVLTGFAISPTLATIGTGSIQKFSTTGTYSDGSTADLSSTTTWAVSDISGSGVASSDADGNVTAKAAGKAAVTATYGTFTASATLVVTRTVSSCSWRDRFQQLYGHAWSGDDIAFVTSDGKLTRGLTQLDLAAQKFQVPDIVKVKGNVNNITEIRLLAPGAGTVLASRTGAYIYGLGYAMWLEVNGYGEAGITEVTLIRQLGLEAPNYQQLVAMFRGLTKTAESQVQAVDLADFQTAAAQLMSALESGSLTFIMGTGHGADFFQTAQHVAGKTFSFQLSNGLGLDPQLGFQRDGVWGPLWQSYGPTGGWSASQPGMQPKCGGCTVDHFAGTTYELCDGPSDRATAESACESYGGNLATVNDLFTSSFLRALAPNAGSAFIGLNDINALGSYLWATGKAAAYLDWAPGQPDDYMGLEHCVQLYDAKSSTQWNDINCTTTLPYLCQLP